MSRFFCILLIFCMFAMTGHAGGKDEKLSRMTFGIEWGYVAAIYSGCHYYFLAPEGYRVDERIRQTGLVSNADMYVYAGYNLNDKWNLALYVGYEGIADHHEAIPVSLRMTRYFSDNPMADRWFSFIDLGSGVCIKKEPQEIITSKAGIGYSLSLSRYAALDFILSTRFIHTHAQIYYDSIPIPLSMTGRNLVNVCALSLGIALKF